MVVWRSTRKWWGGKESMTCAFYIKKPRFWTLIHACTGIIESYLWAVHMFILVNQLLSHLEECVYARSVGLGLLGYLLSIALFTVLISRKPSHSGKSIPAKPPAFDTQSVGGSPAIFTRQGFHSNHPVAGAALADSHLVYIKHIQTRLYNIVGCRGLFKRSTKKKKKKWQDSTWSRPEYIWSTGSSNYQSIHESRIVRGAQPPSMSSLT